MNILILSILILVPGESLTLVGFELLLTGLILYFFILRLDLRNYRHTGKEFKNRYLLNLCLDQLASLPYIICGTAMLMSGEIGIFWIVPAIVFSFIKAVLDAWVLLVEINR
jgi:modulator of FtsH protease